MHVVCKHVRGELIALRGAGDALSCSDHLCKPLKGKAALFERLFSLSVKFNNILNAVSIMNDFYV